MVVDVDGERQAAWRRFRRRGLEFGLVRVEACPAREDVQAARIADEACPGGVYVQGVVDRRQCRRVQAADRAEYAALDAFQFAQGAHVLASSPYAIRVATTGRPDSRRSGSSRTSLAMYETESR